MKSGVKTRIIYVHNKNMVKKVWMKTNMKIFFFINKGGDIGLYAALFFIVCIHLPLFKCHCVLFVLVSFFCYFSFDRLSSNICALIATKVIFTVHAHQQSFVPEPIKICAVAVSIGEDEVTTFSLHLLQNTGAKASLCSCWIASVYSALSGCSRAAAAVASSPRTPAWSRSPRRFSSGWCAAGGRPRGRRGGAAPCGTGSLCARTDASGSLPAGCWPRSPGCGRHLCRRHLSLESVCNMTGCDERGGGGGGGRREWVLCVTGRGFDVFIKDPVEVCLSRLRTEIHLTARPALNITRAATDFADEMEIIFNLWWSLLQLFDLVFTPWINCCCQSQSCIEQ